MKIGMESCGPNPRTYSKAEYDALHAEAEALRAENGRLRADYDNAAEDAMDAAREANRLRTDLEAARGLLESFRRAAMPVIRLHLDNASVHPCDEQNDRVRANECSPKIRALYDALTATPQPGQDVRALAASLYQACGAYDMPERILDALSAAANGEPFTHMIDGLLPCVPPSDQEVRSLLSADDVRDACANAVSVFAEVTNADQCREVAEYMREVLLAQIAKQQAKGKGGKHE